MKGQTMFQKIKSMYRAGRAGQPMPARVDRSVGEAVGTTAVTLALVTGVFFAIGAGSAAAERLFSHHEDREIQSTKRKIMLAELNRRLKEVEGEVEDEGKKSE